MIEVDNKIFDVSIWTLLNELKYELDIRGIDKLRSKERKGDNIRITCPCHKDGKENHPSCSILTQSKKYRDEELPIGYVRCFTCDYKATLFQFISDCLGCTLEQSKQWIISKFDYNFKEVKANFIFEPKSHKKPKDKPLQKTYIDEEFLQSLRYYHPYMWERKLTPEIVEKFDIGYNKQKNAISFPVYDDKGCLFIIYRFVKPWGNFRFEIPTGIEKEIFGMNHITEDMHTVIVCEAVFDALTCWVHGRPAIALFGTGSSEQMETLKKCSHIKHLILGFDNDEAGRKAYKKFKDYYKYSKLITGFKLPKKRKDINELTDEEFNNLINI